MRLVNKLAHNSILAWKTASVQPYYFCTWQKKGLFANTCQLVNSSLKIVRDIPSQRPSPDPSVDV